MKSSTRADIMIEDLITKLTSIHLTSNHRGTTQYFIMNFIEDLRKFEDIAPKTDHWTPVMKKSMLRNSLDVIKVFSDLKATEFIEVAKGRGPIIYKDYIPLVQKVAVSYDRNRVSNTRRLIQSAYRTETNHEYESDENNEDSGDYDISKSVSFSGVNHQPKLPKRVWYSLSKEDYDIWLQLSDQAKLAIINHHVKPDGIPEGNKPSALRTPSYSEKYIALKPSSYSGRDDRKPPNRRVFNFVLMMIGKKKKKNKIIIVILNIQNQLMTIC